MAATTRWMPPPGLEEERRMVRVEVETTEEEQTKEEKTKEENIKSVQKAVVDAKRARKRSGPW